MHTNNVDHCTRLCHSPSVEAMLVSMGSGATSNSYQDYEEAGCLMIVGADASANHPVIAIRFRRAMRRGARVIVINPKRIELCDQADLWLAPRPGTDTMLFNDGARDRRRRARRRRLHRAPDGGVSAWRASLADATLGVRRPSPASRRAHRAGALNAHPPFSLLSDLGHGDHAAHNGIHTRTRS
jgi:hypothetical protein